VFVTSPTESDGVLLDWPSRVNGEFEGYEGYYTLNQGQGIPEVIEALYVPRLVLDQYRNGIVILSDQGSAFTTRPLLYSLVTKDSTIHQLLMQKRDGTYYLALWRERQLYDVNTQTQVALGTSTVELTFANTPKLLETFQFENNGDVATASVSAVSHLALQVSDAVLLLRIK